MSPNIRGGIAVCAAMFLFVINDTLVKTVSARLPAHEIMLLRGFVSVVAALIWCWQLGLMKEVKSALTSKDMLLRGVMEGLIAFTFIWAVAYMPLPDITAILLLSPLILTALSIPLLGEKVGIRRAFAIILGFVGMLFVMRPTGEGLGLPGFVALISATLTAYREIQTRKYKASVSSHVAMLYACAGVLVLGFAITLFKGFVMPTLSESVMILFAGLTVMLGNYYIVTAYRGTDVSVVSAFRYSVILFAILSGLVIFGDIPDRFALFGIVLIVIAGLYTLYRERKLKNG